MISADGYNVNERGNYVMDNGEFIYAIDYYGHRVVLYIVDQEYWEVFINKRNCGIVDVRLLEAPTRLYLYCQHIDISDLLE